MWKLRVWTGRRKKQPHDRKLRISRTVYYFWPFTTLISHTQGNNNKKLNTGKTEFCARDTLLKVEGKELNGILGQYGFLNFWICRLGFCQSVVVQDKVWCTSSVSSRPKALCRVLAGLSTLEKNPCGCQSPLIFCWWTAQTETSDASTIRLIAAVGCKCVKWAASAKGCFRLMKSLANSSVLWGLGFCLFAWVRADIIGACSVAMLSINLW